MGRYEMRRKGRGRKKYSTFPVAVSETGVGEKVAYIII